MCGVLVNLNVCSKEFVVGAVARPVMFIVLQLPICSVGLLLLLLLLLVLLVVLVLVVVVVLLLLLLLMWWCW